MRLGWGFEALDVTDVVIDPDTVNATCIGGQQWFEEDFESEEETEDEAEDETAEDETEEDDETEDEDDEAEAKVAADGKNAGQPNSQPAKKAAGVKHITAEEARKQVQGVVRNWLLEEADNKTATKPG